MTASTHIDGWTVVNSYFRDRTLAKMEIDSFNQFIEKKLPEIIHENNEVTPKIEEVRVEFDKINVLKPRIVEADGSPRNRFTPAEARLRNRTYSSPIYLTMKLLRRDVEQDRKETYIGELPVMLKSNLCWLNGKTSEELVEMGEDAMDFGGYFIINGSEKALMTQEVLASDRVIVSEQTDKIVAEVISTRGAFKGRVRIIRNPDGILNVTFPASPRKLKLFVLLKALGLKTTQTIQEAFIDEREIQNDVLINNENLLVKSEKEALDKIGKFVAPGQVEEYRLRRAQEVIDAFLLPHIGQDQKNRLAKAYYLVMMATKAVERAYNLREQDDKDHYSNKRLELSGKLMEHLFRYSFKYFIKDLKFQIDRTVTRRRKLNISTIVRPGAVSERIRFAMSTGNWIGRATGVSKFMDRVNYLSPLTDLRKVKSPLDKNRELYEARDVHGTHWGRLCVDKDTSVLMGDGVTQEPIKNLTNSWKENVVMTVDKITKQFVPSTLKAYQMFNPPMETIKIETEAGRSLIATVDHPILNEKNQWVEGGKLTVGDKVVIYPTIENMENEMVEKTIVDEAAVKRFYPHNAVKIIKKLKAKGLFPLTTKHKDLPVIARLFGFMLTDGYLGKSCTEFYLGDTRDMETIRADIRSLGIEPGVEELMDGEIEINNRKTHRKVYALLHRAELRPLVLLLGMPCGRKTDIGFTLPTWIKESSLLVKREFLGGLLGGDGPKPRIVVRKGRKNSSKVHLDGFVFHKKSDLRAHGEKYAEELKELFSLFGVSVKPIKINDAYTRKDGVKTIRFLMKFANSRKTIANLTKKIGYRYCIQKGAPSAIISEYLRIRDVSIKNRKELKSKIIKLSANRTPKQISVMLGVKRKFVQTVLERKDKFKETVGSRTLIPPVHEWLGKQVFSASGLVTEKIVSIEKVDCKDVRDFTTREDTHSFIANGFVTHNCAIETPDGPQCVAPQTEMILSSGEKVTIAQYEAMWREQKVASLDWESKVEAEANTARFLRMEPQKKVVELTTKETGRKITATIDHPFYSERCGKTELANLKAGDRVAVMPTNPIEFEKPEGTEILSAQDIATACPPKTDVKMTIDALTKMGLVPLKDNDQRLLALTRLLGHAFGDGSLTISMKKHKSACAIVFSGTEPDLEEIRKDLAAIGFGASKQSVYRKESVLSNGRKISGFSRRMDCYSKPLWVLLHALGAPAGDKAARETHVPQWLNKQRKIVVKEFLAAYFGSEMTTPKADKRDGKTFLQPVFSLNKVADLTENGIAFVEEIKGLLSKFGVEMASTKIVYGTTRKNGTETRKIKAKLKGNLENLLKLYGTISFNYCAKRKSLARIAYSYLQHREFMIRNRARMMEQVISLYNSGASTAKIAGKFAGELRNHDVANWVKAHRKGMPVSARVSEKDFPEFNDWIREHAISENGMVWETIGSTNEAIATEVMDITTLEGYHNFFANGFLTGNCGLVKNLAMLAQVTTESEEEPIEKLLRDMGVKLK